MSSIQSITSVEAQQFQDVDNIIVRSVTAGDPLIATEYGASLIRMAEIKGLALAKLLHGLRSNWTIFEQAGIDTAFENFVKAHMDLSNKTAFKYSDMWRNIFHSDFVSETLKRQLESLPIQQLLLLNAAVEEGSISEEELKIVVVSDIPTTREIIQRARGREVTSSKTAIVISVVTTEGNPRFPKGTILASRAGETISIAFF